MNFLHASALGLAGVDVPNLLRKLVTAVSQDFSQLMSGDIIELKKAQTKLYLKMDAILKRNEQRKLTLDLGLEHGFTIESDFKVAFDSSKLDTLVAALGVVLKRAPYAAAVTAILSLFTVTSNIGTNGKLTGANKASVRLEFVPAFLENVRVSPL